MSQAPERVETLISAEQIHRRVVEMGRRITADFPGRPGEAPLHLVGVLKGSVVFLADLARAIERHVSFDFIGAASYGSSTQSAGEIRLTKDIERKLAGLDVLLVEDIVDTGLTVRFLLDYLGSKHPRSLQVAALLDKPSRRVEPVSLAYVGFEIPDEFVVGYGLDYDERHRNRPDIGVLRGASAGSLPPE